MPQILIIHSEKHNPWYNLALEEYLMEMLQKPGHPFSDLQAILYLWQNQDTVVIGRNQNAWAECLTGLLESEGGRLARRSTGGGAVFHDLGNLNFSLILPRDRFDLDRNFNMILEAVSLQGIPAERSGRNDILANGLKFSGNAFSLRKTAGLHHGTLLIHSDYGRVARYLTVSSAKLQSKGIASVRSRITNLQAINPAVTVETMSLAMEKAFIDHFGGPEGTTPLGGTSFEIIRQGDDIYRDDPLLCEIETRYASWEWRYGETMKFDADIEQRLEWGMVHLGVQVEKGQVVRATIYSDALDSDFIEMLPGTLNGCRFHSADMAHAILQAPCQGEGFGPDRHQMVRDLADLILEQNW